MKAIYAMLIISLILPLTASAQLQLDFSVTSKGNGDDTLTSYCYLKESRVEETGYTRGLKSGSMNYLEGNITTFKEKLVYEQGNGTTISNTSLRHTLDVDFNGTRGISEFFGKGFFPNNRALSAWKKIRYEVSPTFGYKTDGEWKKRDLPANKIRVKASVDMETRKISSYNFRYWADVKKGVIETWDSAGWTNRSGGSRIDVEHTALMTGDIEITNNLSQRLYPASETTGDWLPCCLGGTDPPFEQLDIAWPTKRVYDTLKSDRVYPQQEREAKYKFDPVTNKKTGTGEYKYKNITECKSTNCSNYQCVYTYDEAPSISPGGGVREDVTAVDRRLQMTLEKPCITNCSLEYDFTPTIKIKAKRIKYVISVTNLGTERLNDVKMLADFPSYSKLDSTSYINQDGSVDASRGNIEILPREQKFSAIQSTQITWLLGSFGSQEKKTLQAIVYMKSDMDEGILSFSGFGKAADSSIVQAEVNNGFPLPSDPFSECETCSMLASTSSTDIGCSGGTCGNTANNDTTSATESKASETGTKTASESKSSATSLVELSYVVEKGLNNTLWPFALNSLENAKERIYLIEIANDEIISLNNVEVIWDLDPDMRLANTHYVDSNRGTIVLKPESPTYLDGKSTSITWDLGGLQSGEKKTFLARVFMKPDTKEGPIKIEARAIGPDGNKIYVDSSKAKYLGLKTIERAPNGASKENSTSSTNITDTEAAAPEAGTA